MWRLNNMLPNNDSKKRNNRPKDIQRQMTVKHTIYQNFEDAAKQ